MPVNSYDDYPMSWRPDLSGRAGPKYRALAEMLEEDIRRGVLKPGTRLPPQRELADFLDVNLSTISKVYKLCEQKGLLSASVGNGTYVSSDAAVEPVMLRETGTPAIDLGALVPFVPDNLKIRQQVEKLLKAPDALSLFSYGVPEGTRRQREAGAAWLDRVGLHTGSRNIVLAAGGQNALAASLGALFERGDKVGADPLTYPGVKTAAKLLGIHLIPVQWEGYEMTEEGIRYAVQNEGIKGLYVIPDLHNPTSHIMSLETRRMIAGVAAEKGLIVVEDGINHLLTEKPLPPIASFAPEQTVYLSSLSKTVSAGLRTAFVCVPEKRREALVAVLYAMNIAVSPLLATVAAGLIEDGGAAEVAEGRKRGIAERNRIADEILGDYALECAPTSPLRYLRLPEHFTGRSFEICARQAGVEVCGAERFAVGNRSAERAVRISVTTPPTVGELAEGLRRLKALLEQ